MDSDLHTRLAIVTENELELAFPPRNLPKKFRPDPSTFYLVIVVTDKQTEKQTDRQTYAGDSIIPRESFRGIMTGAVFRLNIGPIVRLFLTAIILADSIASRHISVYRASAVCLSGIIAVLLSTTALNARLHYVGRATCPSQRIFTARELN